ncbi:hypothetical protein KC332_g7437 [Hortaea werneckii]|nr:hypothetical protein KC358_g1818 [Hortaea werneckii]KAI6849826.1 hypothetical protein KC350_g2416 [Hortaea werneckii]KAI6935958.1 hypothetical protein KC341_g6566 [Hortaea werneckii]KAI6970090.1 hypothetical protein KC321_g7516 [Hortaea werneckii]KAI6998447.1 hypothetical protein KC329_g1201 [Hortaea werneckii]
MSSNQFPKTDNNVPAKPFKLTGRTTSTLKANDIQTFAGTSASRAQQTRESTPTPSVSSAPGTSSRRRILLPESATLEPQGRQQMRASSAAPTTFNTREEAAAASLMSMREDQGPQSSQHKRHASLSSPTPTNQKVRKAAEGSVRTSGTYGEQRQDQRPLMYQATPAAQLRASAPPQINQQQPRTSRQGLNDIRQRLLGPHQGPSAAVGHPQAPFPPTPTASAAGHHTNPQFPAPVDPPFYPRDYTGKKIVGKPPSSPAAIAAANHMIAGLKAVRDFAEQEYGFTRAETKQMFMDATKFLREDLAREKEEKKQVEMQEEAKAKAEAGKSKRRGSGADGDGKMGGEQ